MKYPRSIRSLNIALKFTDQEIDLPDCSLDENISVIKKHIEKTLLSDYIKLRRFKKCGRVTVKELCQWCDLDFETLNLVRMRKFDFKTIERINEFKNVLGGHND